MFFGSGIVGYDVYSKDIELQDLLTIYNVVEIYGGNVGTTIDKLWGRNIPLDISTIQHYTSSNYFPSWTPETYMYAEYEGSYEAGSIQGLTEPIKYWNIYRQEVKLGDDGIYYPVGDFVYIDKIAKAHKVYSDFNVTYGKTYRYYLFAQTETQFSIPSISNDETSDYYGYFFIDVADKTVYKIDAEVTASGQNMNLRTVTYDNNMPFSGIQKAKTKYMSGDVSGILIEDIEHSNSLDIITRFRDFVYQDGYKYMKTRKGEIFNIFLNTYNETIFENTVSEQPLVSNLSWQERGEVLEPIEIKRIEGKVDKDLSSATFYFGGGVLNDKVLDIIPCEIDKVVIFDGIPVKPNYIFSHWEDEEGNRFNSKDICDWDGNKKFIAMYNKL